MSNTSNHPDECRCTLCQQHQCEHQWVDSTDGPDVIGKHCSECGLDYDYSEDDL